MHFLFRHRAAHSIALLAFRPYAPIVQSRRFTNSLLTPAIISHLEQMKRYLNCGFIHIVTGILSLSELRRYVAVEQEMTALSEAGDHTKIARLGKEFSDLAKAMDLYGQRSSLLKGAQDIKAMQIESDR